METPFGEERACETSSRSCHAVCHIIVSSSCNAQCINDRVCVVLLDHLLPQRRERRSTTRRRSGSRGSSSTRRQRKRAANARRSRSRSSSESALRVVVRFFRIRAATSTRDNRSENCCVRRSHRATLALTPARPAHVPTGCASFCSFLFFLFLCSIFVSFATKSLVAKQTKMEQSLYHQ